MSELWRMILLLFCRSKQRYILFAISDCGQAMLVASACFFIFFPSYSIIKVLILTARYSFYPH
jgi:hypothetical protein